MSGCNQLLALDCLNHTLPLRLTTLSFELSVYGQAVSPYIIFVVGYFSGPTTRIVMLYMAYISVCVLHLMSY